MTSPRRSMTRRSLPYLILILWPVMTAPASPIARPEDPCYHPIPPEAWGTMTPSQREFQQAADQFTHSYIDVVFGDGPYPACLYQSVRDYFAPVAGATPEQRELASQRRDRARRLLLLVQRQGLPGPE